MDELHINSIDKNIVPKEGQRNLMCSNKKSIRCPSLGYKHITDPNSEEYINKAFDILFEEIININKE